MSGRSPTLGAMSADGCDPEKVAAFWSKIAATSDTFVESAMHAGMEGTQTQEFDEASDALNAVCQGLLLVVGGHDAARPEVIISAGGIRDLFPAVLAVVDAAPAEVTRRYDVRAFRPRLGDPTRLKIRLKGNEIGVSDLRWKATQHRRDRSKCDLTIYVPGFIDALPADSSTNRGVVEPVFLLLDHVVGEWAVETQVDGITWASPKAATSADLPTLDQLSDYLDKISAQ